MTPEPAMPDKLYAHRDSSISRNLHVHESLGDDVQCHAVFVREDLAISREAALIDCIKGSEKLIVEAQNIIAEWIIPDNKTTDEAAMKFLLALFDGPFQRKIQSANKRHHHRSTGAGREEGVSKFRVVGFEDNCDKPTYGNAGERKDIIGTVHAMSYGAGDGERAACSLDVVSGIIIEVTTKAITCNPCLRTVKYFKTVIEGKG